MTSTSLSHVERIRYQWYMGYDREHEYDKNPSWADPLRVKFIEPDEEHPMDPDTMHIYDVDDPEYVWMKSDTHVKLMDKL